MFKDLGFFIKVNGFILIILAKFAVLKLKIHYYAHLFIPIIHFFAAADYSPNQVGYSRYLWRARPTGTSRQLYLQARNVLGAEGKED